MLLGIRAARATCALVVRCVALIVPVNTAKAVRLFGVRRRGRARRVCLLCATLPHVRVYAAARLPHNARGARRFAVVAFRATRFVRLPSPVAVCEAHSGMHNSTRRARSCARIVSYRIVCVLPAQTFGRCVPTTKLILCVRREFAFV